MLEILLKMELSLYLLLANFWFFVHIVSLFIPKDGGEGLGVFIVFPVFLLLSFSIFVLAFSIFFLGILEIIKNKYYKFENNKLLEKIKNINFKSILCSNRTPIKFIFIVFQVIVILSTLDIIPMIGVFSFDLIKAIIQSLFGW